MRCSWAGSAPGCVVVDSLYLLRHMLRMMARGLVLLAVAGSGTSAHDVGLSTTTYKWQLVAVNVAGESEPSDFGEGNYEKSSPFTRMWFRAEGDCYGCDPHLGASCTLVALRPVRSTGSILAAGIRRQLEPSAGYSSWGNLLYSSARRRVLQPRVCIPGPQPTRWLWPLESLDSAHPEPVFARERISFTSRWNALATESVMHMMERVHVTTGTRAAAAQTPMAHSELWLEALSKAPAAFRTTLASELDIATYRIPEQFITVEAGSIKVTFVVLEEVESNITSTTDVRTLLTTLQTKLQAGDLLRWELCHSRSATTTQDPPAAAGYVCGQCRLATAVRHRHSPAARCRNRLMTHAKIVCPNRLCWCADSQACLIGGSSGPAIATGVRDRKVVLSRHVCPPTPHQLCSQHSACNTCMGESQADCTWCASSGKCMPEADSSSNCKWGIVPDACVARCERSPRSDQTLCMYGQMTTLLVQSLTTATDSASGPLFHNLQRGQLWHAVQLFF